MGSTQQPRLLIANRGEIAVRILRTARRLDYFVVSIYTTLDVASPHAIEADLALPVTSYQAADEIVKLVQEHDVQYVIPGYGFLSENQDFAEKIEKDAGAVFVGPTGDHIDAFGIKHQARTLAEKVGVPTCPGTGILANEDDAVIAAAKIGYPVMLKATAGGGGMGLQICNDEAQVRSSFAQVVSRGTALFSNGGVFLERYYPVSRHIEVQVFGDGTGTCVTFGERECSIQRRHQKVVEESPSPFVEVREAQSKDTDKPSLRERLFTVSRQLGSSIKYRSAGTIEYLVDDNTGDFFFLEMNTRLQVEHGITELRFPGLDLVELMLRVAAGSLTSEELLKLAAQPPVGAAIECRVYAENPLKNYMPSPGTLQLVEFPSSKSTRVDTWVRTGTVISLAYDPLVAKVMAYGDTRKAAITAMQQALAETKLQGVVTNLPLLGDIVAAPAFAAGATTTGFLSEFNSTPCVAEILSAGSYTTIQDYPGRVGVGFGIPEGGPMDSLHAQLASLLAGNPRGCELLELTFNGPTIKFHKRAIFAVAGAVAEKMTLTLAGSDDKISVPMFASMEAPAGSVLSVGAITGGSRAYLAIHGGFPGIPLYLGSKGTSPVADIGGLQGRPLVGGDLLDIIALPQSFTFVSQSLPEDLIPKWDPSIVYCLSGPHDSEEIITPAGLVAMYESDWTVSHQASRVGVRLHGPSNGAPGWARKTGGEGGSHPSNYIDYPYSYGALNWTGDSSVLFPADLPSLGGFVSSQVVARAEMFKVAQLRPGDKFKFAMITADTAVSLRKQQEAYLEGVKTLLSGGSAKVAPLSFVVGESGLAGTKSSAILSRYGDITIRQAGDSSILIEFLQTLDLDIRYQAQSVLEAVEHAHIPGVRLATPIGCSLLVEYDSLRLPQAALVNKIEGFLKEDEAKRKAVASSASSSSSIKLASRIIRLPMVFDDKVNRAAVERYMATQRSVASYLPDPVEFIARSNGLDGKDAVRKLVLSTRILVVGVGFFNGTPIGVPLDPRARLNVPKFNPSRTFSPEGGLGFGGSFFSCDPIEAPGGYVNFGRSLPGWDKFCTNASFGSRPWLFNNFDQIELYEVGEDAFETLYARFKAGRLDFDIKAAEFDVGAYKQFCESVVAETEAFKARQKVATEREIEREAVLLAQWQEEQKSAKDPLPSLDDIDDDLKITAETHASVYKIPIEKGHKIKSGDVLLILEAMKMEINLCAAPENEGLVVQSIVVGANDVVQPGYVLIVLAKPEASE